MIFRLLRGSGAYAAYTVHEPPDPAADRLDRAESLVFIGDGFSWAAALFAPLWLLANRLWLPLLGYVALIGLIVAGGIVLGVETATGLAVLALHLMIGFEADSLRRWSLENAGWQMLGSVTGDSLGECERRFFEAWLPTQPIIRIGHTGSLVPPPIIPPPALTVSKPTGWRGLLARKS